MIQTEISKDPALYLPHNNLEAFDPEGIDKNRPLSGDWYDFKQSFEFVALENGVGLRYGQIKFTDNTLYRHKDYFTIGDMIRYRQGSASYKYAYVTDITDSYIQINGGSEFVLANDVVTHVGRAISPTPIGHPMRLRWLPQLVADSGTYSNGGVDIDESEQFFFSMTGPIVNMYMSLTDGNLTNDAVLFMTPPTLINGYHTQPVLCFGPTMGWIENPDGSEFGFSVQGSLDFWTFAAGSGTANFGGQMSYHALTTT